MLQMALTEAREPADGEGAPVGRDRKQVKSNALFGPRRTPVSGKVKRRILKAKRLRHGSEGSSPGPDGHGEEDAASPDAAPDAARAARSASADSGAGCNQAGWAAGAAEEGGSAADGDAAAASAAAGRPKRRHHRRRGKSGSSGSGSPAVSHAALAADALAATYPSRAEIAAAGRAPDPESCPDPGGAVTGVPGDGAARTFVPGRALVGAQVGTFGAFALDDSSDSE